MKFISIAASTVLRVPVPASPEHFSSLLTPNSCRKLPIPYDTYGNSADFISAFTTRPDIIPCSR